MIDPTSLVDPHIIWHDLECGSYSADLALWRELADAQPDGPVLDIGAGTGRVALELAATGRRVIALDRDRALLDALEQRAAQPGTPERRAGQLDIETVCADARTFALPHGERVGLCIAPMQTVQLLGGAPGRLEFLRRARAHLLPDGLLACAVLTDVEPFTQGDGGALPWPETRTDGEFHYISQATGVRVQGRRVTIERERRIVPVRGFEGVAPSALPPAVEGERIEHDVIDLDCLTVTELEREGAAIGLRPEPARYIPPTADHSGSAVVMLRV
jgi:SAM-dependent methyltransferase